MRRVGRRSLLKTTAATALLGPTLWMRRANAESMAFGAAKHVIVLYARGGLRSHALFNAVGTPQHNPYGTQTGSAGTQWTPGAVFGSADIETASFGLVPGFHALTGHTAVLTSVDLEPDATRPVIDHDPAVVHLGAGLERGGQGLLSRVIQAHPRYADGISVANVPAVDIGSTTFGRTDTPHVPLRLPSVTRSETRQPIVYDWAAATRDELNRVFTEQSPAAYQARLQRLHEAKHNAFDFSDVLVDPRLDVVGMPDATHAGLTNAQLLEVLGDDDLADLGDSASTRSWGPDVALAIRMLGFGAPMAVVERGIYDTHSDEDEDLPVRAADLVRQLAGLRFLLSKMEHPDGGTYWDKTVVTVVSEFNRNNTKADTGFNSGNGSDHQIGDGFITRNQAIPVMGGPIEHAGAGGRMIGGTDEGMNPQAQSVSMRSLYSTLLDLLGAPHSAFWPDAPVAQLLG